MLALVGSGEYLPPMEPVDRWLLDRLGETPSVVCLPTAAGTEGPERIRYWDQLGIQYFSRLGAEVKALPVVDRESANHPGLADQVQAANFVYLSGGKPNYLFACLAGSRVWQAIQDVLARGGILAGCSAGAMIMGERIFGFPGWTKGFNLLPGTAILPHFDEIPATMVRLARPVAGSLTLLGIEGNTALIQNDGAYEVLGAGSVTVWNRKRKVRYDPGQAVSWP